ncbi:MAG TPA: hypothetical protein VH593_01875 [Ktedonobacteraceae bacterium]|jgi:hypothetical protein
MDEATRQRIIEETLQNLDPTKRKEEQSELAQRLMDVPVPDPVARWQRDAAAEEHKRAHAKQELHTREQAMSDTSADWSQWVRQQIANEHEFMMAIVGAAMGQNDEALCQEVQGKINELRREISHLREMQQRERSLLKEALELARKVHTQELAQANTRLATLEKHVEQLNSAFTAKKQSEKLENLANGIDAVRHDLAPIKRKFEFDA